MHLVLQKPLTLQGAFSDLAAIYSQANALTTIGGRGERFAFMGLACADLSRCVRKGQTHLYPVAVGQMFAWSDCLLEELFRTGGGRVVAKGMCEKYPAGKCGYCQQMPCVCQEAARDEHVLAVGNREQMDWSLTEWQENLFAVYGAANREGGLPRALNRLFEEVAEVGRLLYLAEGADEDLPTIRENIAREFTDVLAWLFAVCSLMEINLEDAVCHVYGSGCPVCRQAPCECKNFVLRPGSGGLAHRFMQAEEIHQHLIRAA